MTEAASPKMPPLWVIKTRAPFLTATLIPVFQGMALAWARTGIFNPWLFLLTLVGAACLHAGTNMTNDYFDHTWGSDEVNTEFANPFTGGSRLIQMGLVEPKEMLWQGLAFFAVGSMIGIGLTVLTPGLVILWLGLVGVFCGYFYTAPPLRLSRLALGELAVGLCFGPLMVLGTYYVQVQSLDWEPIIAALPVGLLITLILWINQFQDTPADASVGKAHLVVRMGRRWAALVYGLLLALTYVSIVGGIAFGGVTPWALLGLLTAPWAWRAYRIAREHYDHHRELIPANALTVNIHLYTGILLTVGYIIQGIVRLFG